ncbi:MAG: EsaB/YukD family protein [Lachnospiraceae bacterium]|nr:EsaB/YukD family protein [Lachnospiraceae bacterium]
MILVDIYVPAVEKNMDFMLDENIPLVQIMTEIREMISKKLMGSSLEQNEEFWLCSMDTGCMLDPRLTLYMNGIRDGSKLVMV